jgi:transposase
MRRMCFNSSVARQNTVVHLSPEDRLILEQHLRASKSEQRAVLRSRIVLAAAAGRGTCEIARSLGLGAETVSKWRVRFAQEGLAGLSDLPRSGRSKRYEEEAVRTRLLQLLDKPPPKGYATWNGKLLAQALGDVSPHQVWRVMRQQGIQLQRRHSWCLSTDPEFAAKAADIIALYLHPPEEALVLSIDEKPHIQALERAQGYLKLPNGRAITGYAHEYKRHGTTTLFAALNIVTGAVKAGHYQRRRRREFLDFLNEVVADCPASRTIHVILDNLSTHKPKHDRWLARHKNVHFHFTPTRASWLNQIECWFSILSRSALKGASFTSPKQLRQAIDDFIDVYNEKAAPFEWRKTEVHPKAFKSSMTDLCN